MFHDEISMPTAARQKFSSQASPQVLAELRKIAAKEGRQFQSVLDEALRDYIARKETGRPRRHVMEALARGVEEFDALYRELAK
jgi:predicted transcriptional regulator